MKIGDRVGFVLAFSLKTPDEVTKTLAQYRTDTYCARDAIRKAVKCQPARWQDEFWHRARRLELDL